MLVAVALTIPSLGHLVASEHSGARNIHAAHDTGGDRSRPSRESQIPKPAQASYRRATTAKDCLIQNKTFWPQTLDASSVVAWSVAMRLGPG